MIVSTEICNICGNRAFFEIKDGATLLREAICSHCGASLRNSDIMGTVMDKVCKLNRIDFNREIALEKLSELTILNASSYGGVHNALKGFPKYKFSEFYPNIKPGEYSENGILCVDLCNIPFNNESIDLLITEDVFEHIEDISKAFSEVCRVLTLNGMHIFSVPIREDGKTMFRKDMPKVYHEGPTGGVIVYNDFSFDICNLFSNEAVETTYEVKHRFYDSNDVTKLEKEYQEYLKYKDNLLYFFRLNSVIFSSIKKISVNEDSFNKKEAETVFTGERMILGKVDKELEIEHLNRYEFARNIFKDKKILDAACGTGYGSAILSSNNNTVVGIDISKDAIEYAKEKFGDSNISFLEGSVDKLPFENNSFDGIVSYETLEHVDEATQNKFLKEIKRILNNNGVLVMSTPNHEVYKERGENHFHVKELNLNEFKILLESKFKNVKIFSQQFEICNIIVEEVSSMSDVKNGFPLDKAEYFIAVCSNSNLPKVNEEIYIRNDNKYKNLMDWAVNNHNLNEKNNEFIKEKLDLIDKLMKEDDSKGKHIVKLDKEIEDNIKQLTEKNNEINEKNNEINEKNNEINEKNNEINEKNEIINRKSEEINTITQANEEFLEKFDAKKFDTVIEIYEAMIKDIENKKKEIKNLEIDASNKQGHINLLLETDRELNRIKNSRSWRFLNYGWKVCAFIVPTGSKRRLVAKVGVKFVKMPVKFIRKLSPRRIKNFFYCLKREGVSGVSKRLDECLRETNAEPVKICVNEIKFENKKITDYEPIVFKKFDNPIVTIIIPVYNQFDYTYNCLKSILNNSGDISYEIIIANDCSTDLTTEIQTIVKNIVVVTNKINLRFLKNCNHAAEQAKGKYILFLNNDTQVQENWLIPLVETIEEDETVGIVGSKLVYSDGRLQEAGGIMWQDASAWNYGNLSDPSFPEYNYLKEVDYISGACIMLKRALWEEIGGFDENFAPAYCEDSDLAFEVRKRGYKVIYQPLSVVVHFEGISNGTDTNSGQKSYQILNQKKFYDKWKDILEKENFLNGENVFVARDRKRTKKTILMIDHYVPQFDRDAGSRTVFQYLKLFTELGFNVKFIGDNFYRHEPYTTVLQQLGIEVLYGSYYSSNWKTWIKENQIYFDYVFLNRPHISVNYIDYIRNNTKAKIIYYGHDLHFLREKREYELTKDKSVLKSSEDWKQKEFKLMKKADVVYYPSIIEENEIKNIDSSIPVKAIPAYLFDNVDKIEYDLKNRKDMMFIGGFGHKPNIDAVLWLSNEILPILVQKIPDIKIYILGSNPPKDIQALANNNLIIKGFVTDEELDEFYRNCRISIVPLRYGAGIKGKVIEAMKCGIPVATTSIGAEGILNAENIMIIEDNPEKYAEYVAELYYDENKLKQMSKQSYEYVEKNYMKFNAIHVIAEDFGIDRRDI